MAIRGRGNKHGQGRGHGDQPQSSHSCTSPPPPHTLLSLGVKDGKNKGQKNELVKGLNAFKNQQKFIAVPQKGRIISSSRPNSSGEPSEIRSSQLVSSSEDEEENDEYYDYDDGEDEEMWLRHQEVDANNVNKCTRVSSEVSNNGKMSNATLDSIPNSTDQPAKGPNSLPSSGGSHVETDRRQVISVDATCNPRRFVPQSVTRDIISIVISRMPTPVDLWKN